MVTLARSLHRTLSVCVIPIVSHEAVIIRSKETVLLIPFEFALCGLLVSHAILLGTACVDINKITVGIILIGMIVVHILALRRRLLCAVVHILHIGELELLSCISSIGVRQIIASIQCAVELHIVLRENLTLRCDTVHIVIAHRKSITCGLVVRTCICTSCADKTIECIVCIGMSHLSASLATLWN